MPKLTSPVPKTAEGDVCRLQMRDLAACVGRCGRQFVSSPGDDRQPARPQTARDDDNWVSVMRSQAEVSADVSKTRRPPIKSLEASRVSRAHLQAPADPLWL
jgi:hypothetical protein